MILLIDNYDSFTFNLYQLICSCIYFTGEIKVIRNDAIEPWELRALRPSHVILSPGPGHPTASGLSLAAPEVLPDTPILGVCLGHQALALGYGAEVVRAAHPRHGSTLPVLHDDEPPFTGLPSPFEAALYHSLSVAPRSLPSTLAVTARSPDGVILGLRHRQRPHHGVQFHPESFMTTAGATLLDNFLNQQ